MKKCFSLFFVAAMTLAAHAQQNNDPVVFEVNGNKIRQSEFLADFLRSSDREGVSKDATKAQKRKALNDYATLFVNYRVKLADAYANGFDKNGDLQKELKGYRSELVAPYLIDSTTMDQLLHEAYDRNHYALNAAHILVRLPRTYTPEDTIKAYNQAMSYYSRIMKGESFDSVCKEANHLLFVQDGIPEGDPRYKDDGELGFFSVFDMVYPFESAAYALKPGEVSKPVRTSFGYHLIKLNSKVPMYGRATLQHIWIAEGNNTRDPQSRAQQAYQQIANGENFSRVCQNYSDDHSTADNGGLLSNMSIRQLPTEYVQAISTMQPGEVSQPFHTSYGWHIVLLVQRDTIPTFDEMVPFYKQRMVRDNRNQRQRDAFIAQCKQRYNFIDYTTTYETPSKSAKGKKVKPTPMASLDECIAAINDSVFAKQWKYRPGSRMHGLSPVVRSTNMSGAAIARSRTIWCIGMPTSMWRRSTPSLRP